MQPRLIRLKNASKYLGMDKNRFNKEVRPYLQELRIGTQGIAFDRLDLDQWVDQYKARSVRSITPKR
jgi:predicted DNA-binding transcriptional regulator AlpA